MSELYRKTPIMGWASWNCFRTHISEEIMKEQADALKRTGLADYGYTYLNMDDGFFGGRDKNGRLLFHKERFPNGIKVIADYAHSLGLKAGTYADGGDNTCGHYYDSEDSDGVNVGLYGYEEQDLKMYLEEFGFDFIKVDWCGGVRLGLDEEEQYTKIGNIIDEIRKRTGRQLVYNICRWQFPGPWAAKVADSWRTGADITPDFDSIMYQLDMIKPLARYCSPGHINDLDMMQIGNGGLTREEEQTHFAMWCMMSTPLMIGCDLTKINDETLSILKNKELIEINQNSACLQAFVVKEIKNADGELLGEVWIKDLGEKNSRIKAVAFLNRSDNELDFEFDLSEAGLCGNILSARDLCEHSDIKIGDTKTMSGTLKPHGISVLKIEAEESAPVINKDDKGEIEKKPVIKITHDEARELMKNGAVLVDVRTEEEYKKSHLDGAINISYLAVQILAKERIPDKATPVIVYCATGKRSSQAKTSLDYLGYENVHYLGGIAL
ncbi:MAG: glycoside hydrolase family 27 protein [Clostridia bacterium]|nr:glycoside hydrolase family 27 protein [Clostridia bacterium]